MKTIIVPVDFSAAAANAANFAVNLAAFYGAEVWLYHAYEIPRALTDFAYPTDDIEEMQKAADEELDEIAAATKAKLNRHIVLHTKAEMNVLNVGLQQMCIDLKPDLVVMGLSGKNSVARLFVGSNTIKAIDELKYPLLVIPPGVEFVPIRKIGFACDYSLIDKTTQLSLLKKIVHDFHAELHVLNVDKAGKSHTRTEQTEAILMNDLLKDTKAEYHVVEANDVTEGINWFIEKVKLDWIMMIPKKHGLLDKLFKRSNTKQLVLHTHTPVLCIHE